ncbi:hypothetical protein CDL15_Pgr000760 [Punica granatum]|uniref:Protein prenyltransferase alpha subunit repeat-containing protein 1 n=1 Tax=Punica granatum TaxID=22663 RepID=A0A218W4B9_PUNGR|nr:hypothetical protein CDL15_Pgr000760 [Punica granatum]
MADIAHAEGESFGLLQELEHILESDPLIDEIGFIHPTQLAALNGEVDVDSLSEPVSLNFFSKDHKLGISTQILFPLYEQAKKAFFDVVTRYKIQGGIFDSPNTRDELEVGVMKHSKALLLLSADLGTAWNSRRAIALEKDALSTYMDELRLSELILSYSAKSDQAWSHRRWVIKRIAGKVPNLQEILRKESELVEKIAERSKMNYRAWNHRCWLVSYMTAGERLMMRILEAFCSRNASASNKSNEIYETWKALWLYRRFLSLHWLRHFTMEPDSVSCKSKHTANTSDDGPSIFLDNELHLFSSCSTIPDNDFDDFQAQAMHSATYILWLAKQLPRPQAIELREKLNIGDMKALLTQLSSPDGSSSRLSSSSSPPVSSTSSILPFISQSSPVAISEQFMISHGRRTKLFHLLQWRQLHSGPSTSDFKDTHQIKLLNRSCKARKYSEYLYFLERLVSKLNYKPEVVLCTKLIKGFFGLGKLEKTLRVMEILEKYGEPDVFSYNAVISGFCKLNQVESANRVLERMTNCGVRP